jgi:hypothetical protein
MSTLRVDTIKTLTSDITLYSAKAWVYFNAATMTIISSKNIAGISSPRAGNYRVTTSAGLYANNYFTWVINAARPQGANGPEVHVVPNLDRNGSVATEVAPVRNSDGSVVVQFYCFEEFTASNEQPNYCYAVFY